MNATINQNNVDSDASIESDVYEDNQTPYTGNGEEESLYAPYMLSIGTDAYLDTGGGTATRMLNNFRNYLLVRQFSEIFLCV
jgi:hypothetical protein